VMLSFESNVATPFPDKPCGMAIGEVGTVFV
jgi:hypothetical protein